jgi:uncharacterized protein
MNDINDIIRFDEIDEHGPQSYSGTFEFTPEEIDRVEVPSAGPVEIEARVQPSGAPGAYEVEGTATFTSDFHCSRCLEPYPFANTSAFHVRFRPRPELSEENEEIEIADPGDLDVEFYSERQIPLRDLALEQVQLSIPMKPLCEESCLGLCLTCGANRNREGCGCETAVGDGRWGALAEFREQLARKKDV